MDVKHKQTKTCVGGGEREYVESRGRQIFVKKWRIFQHAGGVIYWYPAVRACYAGNGLSYPDSRTSSYIKATIHSKKEDIDT